jgi:hypothetical protein
VDDVLGCTCVVQVAKGNVELGHVVCVGVAWRMLGIWAFVNLQIGECKVGCWRLEECRAY